MDQSFTSENFLKIYDKKNRKGIYLDDKFFPSVAKYTSNLKQIHHDVKQLQKASKIKKLTTTEKLVLKSKIEEKDSIRSIKRVELTSELKKIESALSGQTNPVKIKKHKNKDGIYITDDNAMNYFVLKQLCSNIESLYKIKVNNHNHIVAQIKQLLNDKFPKIVIKTDIKSFYESIDHERIIKKLIDDALLTPTSIRLIKSILSQYKCLSTSNKGIPRGIDVSSLLSEIYMRSFDREIKELDNVIYSVRYVDDIVVMFAGTPDKDASLNAIKKLLDNDKLTCNNDKTVCIDTQKVFTFDYLGYKFARGSATLQVRLTDTRFEKYQAKIDEIFTLYNLKSKYNLSKHASLLKLRVKYITNNTRLTNNKNICVGVYFSNRHLNCDNDMINLDNYLKNKISMIVNENFRGKLEKYSFCKGYNEKIFHKYTIKQLQLITSVWKNG